MADLSPYYDETEDLRSLRTNSSQAGEDDGDHPKDKPKAVQDKPKIVQVQMSCKEVEFLVGYSEPSPPSPTRNWPNFVTLVS